MDLASLELEQDGAQLWEAAIGPVAVEALRALAPAEDDGRPGARLTGGDTLANHLTGGGALGRIAVSILGPRARPVRAVMFDKSPSTNWAVAWHQDRTIAVRERHDVEGFGPWSRKAGVLHVAPPVSILAGLVTLRAHLDDCDVDNAPLHIVLGSHLWGLVPAAEAASRAVASRTATSLAQTGDVWAYRTLILHASDKAARPSRRRVLQVDYAAFELPGSLVWASLEAL